MICSHKDRDSLISEPLFYRIFLFCSTSLDIPLRVVGDENGQQDYNFRF